MSPLTIGSTDLAVARLRQEVTGASSKKIVTTLRPVS